MRNQDSAQPAMHLFIPLHRLQSFVGQRFRVLGLCTVPFLLMMVLCAQVWANDVPQHPAERFADDAKAMWDSGAIGPALDILEEGIQQYPDALALKTLRGDMLATFRDPGEAIKAYDTVLASNTDALDVRWAKW